MKGVKEQMACEKCNEMKKMYELAVAEREANVKGFTEQLSATRTEAVRAFAKFAIDRAEGGCIAISDIPDLVHDFLS